MSIPDQLRNIRDNLQSGRFGQREIWEQQLEEAAVEIERLKADRPFLGELRASQFAAIPRDTGFVHSYQIVQAVAVTRLEQWNGKEWVLVAELWP